MRNLGKHYIQLFILCYSYSTWDFKLNYVDRKPSDMNINSGVCAMSSSDGYELL